VICPFADDLGLNLCHSLWHILPHLGFSGVSTYSLEALQNEIRRALPTPEELQEALGGEGQDES